MLKIDVLASGSKGNSTLITTGEGKKLLIDCGISARALTSALRKKNTSLSEIKAILITHEHADHVHSVAQISEAYNVPVFANSVTMSALKRKTGLKGGYFFEETSPFNIMGLEIRPFRTSHDAVYPVGYSLLDGESKFTYATDLGYFSPSVKENVKDSDVVLIESNHDVDMLLHGPYPKYLKERILSNRGHLSNHNCAEAIRDILNLGTKKFILGHLSEQNNTYALARETTLNLLEKSGATLEKDYNFFIATQQGLDETILTK